MLEYGAFTEITLYTIIVCPSGSFGLISETADIDESEVNMNQILTAILLVDVISSN